MAAEPNASWTPWSRDSILPGQGGEHAARWQAWLLDDVVGEGKQSE
jgi:hypothetical protein